MHIVSYLGKLEELMVKHIRCEGADLNFADLQIQDQISLRNKNFDFVFFERNAREFAKIHLKFSCKFIPRKYRRGHSPSHRKDMLQELDWLD